ncbi:hypothetical protein BGAL_0125g00250 [Botrytis galanthina]|uniref:Uncharacterized protein n=1 Tax=Botrytis galanthina TaxID=278940 RepID=A0A4S8QZZ4_9HELO|nr:hypothetical protein BGAL_0125g00250 [Botrytis galanthina]
MFEREAAGKVSWIIVRIRPACILVADGPYRKGKYKCFQGYLTTNTGLCPYSRVPTPSYALFEKGTQWLCCLAPDPGLLTSDEEEQSSEHQTEEEEVSQKA